MVVFNNQQFLAWKIGYWSNFSEVYLIIINMLAVLDWFSILFTYHLLSIFFLAFFPLLYSDFYSFFYLDFYINFLFILLYPFSLGLYSSFGLHSIPPLCGPDTQFAGYLWNSKYPLSSTDLTKKDKEPHD